MKYSLLLILSASLLFCSCNSGNTNNRSEKYGGTLRINITDVPDIIFPGRVLKSSEQLIVNQVYTGLVKYNAENLQIVSSLAKKWRIERNNSLYTFYLHNNAYFHTDACFGEKETKQITAYDVKYSIEKIALYHIIKNHSISTQLKNIEGSEALLNDKISTDSILINGIEVLNDTTIVFKLKKADELFLHFLAGTNSLIFAKEAFQKYGFKNTVGSGAYTYEYPNIKGEAMSLSTNPNYFAKNQQQQKLPFIDTIKVSFITSAKRELNMFEQEQLDLVTGVSGNYVIDFLDRHINEFQSNPPYYLMKQTTNTENKTLYNFVRSNVQNLHFNSLGYFDFSDVYFEEPVAREISLE